jgi:hypothetical protein
LSFLVCRRACDTFHTGPDALPAMEHPCHSCRQAVEDGVPFCQRCGAPQIRVATVEPLLASESAGAEGQSPRDLDAFEPTQQVSNVASPIEWSNALPACALAAAIAAVLMALGLMVPFLAVAGAGFLAVGFYRRRHPGALIKPGAGARLGAVSGLLCFGMSAVLEALSLAIFHKGAVLREKMLEAIQQTASHTTDPQAVAMLDYLKSPGGMAVMMVFVLIFAFVAFVALSSLGGALGGIVLGRANRR